MIDIFGISIENSINSLNIKIGDGQCHALGDLTWTDSYLKLQRANDRVECNK